MKGKNKCKILKEIRQKIADENDIPYVTRECSYQGECRGTCPKCEAELRYLEQELEKRRRLGKTVAVAAVAAGLSLSLTACVPGSGGSGAGSGSELGGEAVPSYTLPSPTSSQIENLAGVVVLPPDTDPDALQGRFDPSGEAHGNIEESKPNEDPTEDAPELLGDVVFFPETPEDLPAEASETEAR